MRGVVSAGLVFLLALPQLASAQPDASSDPYVLLDAAKLMLATGDLDKAQEQLAQIPLAGVEGYVAEEVLVQELLIAGADLTAASFLLAEISRMDQAGSVFGAWLAAEQASRAQHFTQLCRDYFARTAGGAQLDFVRFRLPFVSAEHLQDAALFADPQILGAAVENWTDGREGLGRGVLTSQARVAVVLAAAVHYDLPEPSAKIEAVALRLKAGVPFHQDRWLDWLADTAQRWAGGDDGLNALAAEINQRLLALPSNQCEPAIRDRATARTAGPPEVNTEGGGTSE